MRRRYLPKKSFGTKCPRRGPVPEVQADWHRKRRHAEAGQRRCPHTCAMSPNILRTIVALPISDIIPALKVDRW